jgi:hypothetical protein
MRTQKPPIVFIHGESFFLAGSEALPTINTELGNHPHCPVNDPNGLGGAGFNTVHTGLAQIIVGSNSLKRGIFLIHNGKPLFFSFSKSRKGHKV